MSEIKKINYTGTEYDIGGSSGTGLTDDAKIALLACFENAVWVGDDGQDYYNALYDALYPPANLVSITAVFSQGSNVIYDNQPLSDLKQYLVVTAHYDDSSTATVNTYSLSGDLETGTSTITVGYGGKTTTFNVTVTHATTQYTITNTLTHIVNSNSATAINENLSYSGTLTADNNYVIALVTVTMGNTDITSTAYDDSDGSISIASVTGNIVITAVAVEDVGWISGVPYSADVINTSEPGYRIDPTTGQVYEYESNNNRVTDFIPCHGASAIVLTSGNVLQYVNYYDVNKDFIMAVQGRTSIENPFPVPVPRNAYYFRSGASTTTPGIVPYLYDTLPSNTSYNLNKRYVFDWTGTSDTPQSWIDSPTVVCYGATKLQSSMWDRSFYYFYDGDGQEISSVARGSSADEITIPSGAVTMKFEIPQGNTNNPWFIYTA